MTMKVMYFRVDIPSFEFDNVKNKSVLVFDLTSMLDATEYLNCQELVGERLRLELNFTFHLKHVTDFFLYFLYRGNDCLWLQLTNLVWLGRTSNMDNSFFQHTQVSVHWFISLWLCSNLWQRPFGYYQNATQQYAGEPSIKIANFWHEMYLAGVVRCNKYRFLRQQYKQMIAGEMWSHPNGCCFLQNFLRLFITSSFVKKNSVEIKVLLQFIITRYIEYFNNFNVKVLSIRCICSML